MKDFALIKRYADLIREQYWRVKRRYYNLDAITRGKLKKRMQRVVKLYGSQEE